MVLRKVVYALFLSDAEDLVELNLGGDHEIDREICLTFDDGSIRFVSWCYDPIDPQKQWFSLVAPNNSQHCVGIAQASFFGGPTQLLADVSDSEFWSPLIGTDTPLEFDRDDHQLLKIGVGPAAVFVAAYESGYGWGMDTLRISKTPPDPQGRVGG